MRPLQERKAWASRYASRSPAGLLTQALVMPMMGMGFFSANAPQPFMSMMGTLIGYIVYGAILGAMTGEQVIRVGRAGHVRYERWERHA